MDFEERAENAEDIGDLQSAMALWKELATERPDAVFFCRYGRVATKLEKWDEAEEALTTALHLEPTLPLVMECLGSLWSTRTDKDRVASLTIALDWYRKALTLEHNARILTFLGNIYSELGETERAKGILEQAIGADSNYEEAYYNLGIIEEQASPTRAAELLERAIEIDPAYGMAHQALGRIYQKAGDLVRAEYHFRRSLEIDSSDYWSMVYLANLLSVQGKIAEADQTYRTAINICPEIAAGRNIYARFLESNRKE